MDLQRSVDANPSVFADLSPMKPIANIKLGTAFGIDVLLHWSFFVLPVVVIWFSASQGDSVWQTAVWLILLVVILASVLIHELGHALAARRLGIPIDDIMLTPICGLARLERAPDTPKDEIIVAMAGPLANGLVVLILGFIVLATHANFPFDPDEIRASLLLTLLWVNGALFLLNLLPIFPMDGGRVLRALLALSFSDFRATRIAARLGQALSILAALSGLYWRFQPLVIIGIFLLLTAEQEIRLQRLCPDEAT